MNILFVSFFFITIGLAIYNAYKDFSEFKDLEKKLDRKFANMYSKAIVNAFKELEAEGRIRFEKTPEGGVKVIVIKNKNADAN